MINEDKDKDSEETNVTNDSEEYETITAQPRSAVFKFIVSALIVLIILSLSLVGWYFLFSNKTNPLSKPVQQYTDTEVDSETTLQQINHTSDEVVKQANISDNSREYTGKFNLSQGFSDIVSYALPAVVNVSAVRTIDALPLNIPDNFINPFLKEFFKQFNMPTKKEKALSLGSGFIVRSDGFIVTNFHVIKGAKNIKVTLHDGKVFEASIYASDPLTDLAVLKINVTNLPTLEFADSSAAKVGDWVIAIGNPFGLGGTVSAGIISARGRDINIGLYDEFIQTDAAINKGNSGGPMIDTKARIVGVNTAIFSTTGGSIGIGFAVPSNLVKNIVSQLITDKQVTRGWVGVQIQDIDATMAKALKLPKVHGAIVSGITTGGPADKAGLKVGDVITAVNNLKVDNKKLLPKIISSYKVGETITIHAISNGVEKKYTVIIEKFPSSLENEILNNYNEEEDSRLNSFAIEEVTFEELGLKVSEITNEIRKIFGLKNNISGVIITAVESGSIAEEKGLIPGLIISQVNGKEINNVKTLQAIVQDSTQSTFVLLIVEPSRNLQFFISLEKGKTEDSEE